MIKNRQDAVGKRLEVSGLISFPDQEVALGLLQGLLPPPHAPRGEQGVGGGRVSLVVQLRPLLGELQDPAQDSVAPGVAEAVKGRHRTAPHEVGGNQPLEPVQQRRKLIQVLRVPEFGKDPPEGGGGSFLEGKLLADPLLQIQDGRQGGIGGQQPTAVVEPFPGSDQKIRFAVEILRKGRHMVTWFGVRSITINSFGTGCPPPPPLPST